MPIRLLGWGQAWTRKPWARSLCDFADLEALWGQCDAMAMLSGHRWTHERTEGAAGEEGLGGTKAHHGSGVTSVKALPVIRSSLAQELISLQSKLTKAMTFPKTNKDTR